MPAASGSAGGARSSSRTARCTQAVSWQASAAYWMESAGSSVERTVTPSAQWRAEGQQSSGGGQAHTFNAHAIQRLFQTLDCWIEERLIPPVTTDIPTTPLCELSCLIVSSTSETSLMAPSFVHQACQRPQLTTHGDPAVWSALRLPPV